MSFGIYLTNLGANVSSFTVAPATTKTTSPAATVAQKSLQKLTSSDDIYFVKQGEKTSDLVSEILDAIGVPLFVAMFIVSAAHYLIRSLATETMSELDQTKVDIQLIFEKFKALGTPDKREIILFRDENNINAVGRVDLFVGQELARLNPIIPQVLPRVTQPARQVEIVLQMEEVPEESEFEEISLN